MAPKIQLAIEAKRFFFYLHRCSSGENRNKSRHQNGKADLQHPAL